MNKPIVWNYGGGTQSCAIAVLILKGRIPKPDFALIADTGFEKFTTWAYMDARVKPALESVGVNLVRVSKNDYAYKTDGAFNPSGSLLIPAFTNAEGSGKLTAYCSTYWKKEVVENYLSRIHGLKRSQYVTWIGFSKDEPKRYLRMMGSDDYQNGVIQFPLVELATLGREDCRLLVESYGWPTPPRSSCWMCPNMHDDEWLGLSQEELSLAIDFEKELQKKDPNAWLHKSMKPIAEVVFQPKEDGREYCQQGLCFV